MYNLKAFYLGTIHIVRSLHDRYHHSFNELWRVTYEHVAVMYKNIQMTSYKRQACL